VDCWSCRLRERLADAALELGLIGVVKEVESSSFVVAAAAQCAAGTHLVGLEIEDIRTLIVAVVVGVACTAGRVGRGLVMKLPRLESLTAAYDIQGLGRVVAACGQLPCCRADLDQQTRSAPVSARRRESLDSIPREERDR